MTLPNNLTAVIRHLTTKGYHIHHVFDIGANQGRWTAQFEREMPAAQFLLFEANPKRKRPRGLNPKHRWFNKVLSNDATPTVQFYDAMKTGDSYYKEQTHHYDGCTPIELQTVTLDRMVAKFGLPTPEVMKLDTQGSELDILDGAEETLKGVDVLVMEMPVLPYNLGAPSFDEYVDTADKYGFVPIGVEGLHVADNLLVQIDLVFLKKEIKNKYYGDRKVFTKEFNK